jgi:hypothetical protein
VWRPAVLEREHVVAGVVVVTEELALVALDRAPAAQRCNRRPIDRDRLVGVRCFATFLVPCVAFDDYTVVVHRDLARVEVNVRPLESADLAPADTGGQFR